MSRIAIAGLRTLRANHEKYQVLISFSTSSRQHIPDFAVPDQFHSDSQTTAVNDVLLCRVGRVFDWKHGNESDQDAIVIALISLLALSPHWTTDRGKSRFHQQGIRRAISQ
jgi:hypothetical protein